ncbi:MAG: 5-(carboxyamino)imidazole ribonucleotide synthase [Armatimonadetes bacterium JP3_11]|nr:MAG: 5-(carboxyamino)imidazole ribonucleotide synthase [Armatimonadetes bacterium CP1_7O]OYT76044.1 MAG: 5-(carboxyamino)imidazole ribonucleotide synthase [Armatimonadetes bacterium JP3_11]
MRIGILGGGQLGRMLALAGYPLGIHTEVYDPAPDACAGQVAPLVGAPYDDWDALARFAEGKQCITYEFENVPLATAQWLEARVPVHPTPRALELFQDRLLEKQFLNSIGIPTPAFAPIDPTDPDSALERTGLPCVVKTRRFGYDGKGQGVAHTHAEYRALVQRFQPHALIAEALVPFEREVSAIGVRSLSGEIALYPLVENIHQEGILRVSIVDVLPPLLPTHAAGEDATRSPSPRHEHGSEGEDYVRRLLEALNYVGVVALEMFQVGARLLANEVAPRVHNSGHWTIEGAETSQFENHLRAILGLPLGSVAPRGYCAMVNLIGALPPIEAVLRIPNAHLHLYGKTPRPGRKLGHITLRADTREARDALLQQTLELLSRV